MNRPDEMIKPCLELLCEIGKKNRLHAGNELQNNSNFDVL